MTEETRLSNYSKLTMIEQILHSLGPALPASLSHKLFPEDDPDAEAGDEGCSDLLSANQNRSTAKDGRRDVSAREHKALICSRLPAE